MATAMATVTTPWLSILLIFIWTESFFLSPEPTSIQTTMHILINDSSINELRYFSSFALQCWPLLSIHFVVWNALIYFNDLKMMCSTRWERIKMTNRARNQLKVSIQMYYERTNEQTSDRPNQRIEWEIQLYGEMKWKWIEQIAQPTRYGTAQRNWNWFYRSLRNECKKKLKLIIIVSKAWYIKVKEKRRPCFETW